MPGSVLAEGDAPAMARPRKYSDELRERAVRFYFESNRPIAHVAQDLGIHKEALRQWVRQAEADRGVRRDLLKTDERGGRLGPHRAGQSQGRRPWPRSRVNDLTLHAPASFCPRGDRPTMMAPR